MNIFKSCKIWLGGYVPTNVAYEALEDLEPITKIGGLILFAATLAALNWGVAGWTFAIGAPVQARPAIALAAALMGACLVLVLDRSFVYFTDTADEQGFFKKAMYTTLRVVVIITVGSFTAQSVLPLVLGNEMRAHALYMIEDAEKARARELVERYAIADKEVHLKSAVEGVEKFRQSAATLPSDIQLRLKQTQDCWAEHRRRKSALQRAGYSTAEARAKLSGKAAQCNRDSQSANAERTAYFNHARTQLDRAVTQLQAVEADLSKASDDIKARIEQARLVESANINELSSTVLWDLIKDDPGALMKWAAFNLLILICELMPLLQKFQSGQSNIGRQRATHRAIKRIDMAERLEQRKHDFAISSAINVVSILAAEEAMSNPAVHAEFAKAFAAYIPAYAPFEAVRAAMRDIEIRHVDLADFMHRHPQYSSLISKAWSEAIKDATELLARGLYGRTA